jgi:hypothetical protein
MGSAFSTSGLLVEDALVMHSLLAFEGSLFVKKALSGASSLLVGSLLVFVGITLVKKALALLIAKALMTSHFYLFISCALVVKALTTSGLLVLMSGVLVMTQGLPLLISTALVKVLLVMIHGPPQLVYPPLPILVGALWDSTSLTNYWSLQRQQPHSLMILAIGAIKPIFIASIGQGVVRLIRAELPVRGVGGVCDHLRCSQPKGLVGIFEGRGKWASGDPPYLICGGGGREWPWFIIISSNVGKYIETKK